MKIIYVSISTLPSRAANSIHVCKMTQALHQNGHDVKLLAIKSELFQRISPERLAEQYGLSEKIKVKTFNSIRGLRLNDYYYQVVRFVKKECPELIYTRSIPLALRLTRLGFNSVYECHGDIHDTELNQFHELIDRPELKKVVVISKALKLILAQKFGLALDELLYVAHDGVDLERFKENQRSASEMRQALGYEQKYTITYAGHLYPGRGIEVVEALAEEFQNVQFNIVGGNDDDVLRCKKKSQAIGLENLTFHGFVDNSKLPGYLLSSDILLMPYQNKVSVSGNVGNTVYWMSPLKMFEYMSTNRAIISSDLPALREVLDESQCKFCEPDNIEQWKDAVRQLMEDANTAKDLASNALENVKRYTWRVRAENILSEVQS